MAPADRSDGLPGQVAELWRLVVGYARQETLDPIRGLGRFLAFGLLGSVALGLGLVLVLLGTLRLLQTETGSALDDGWSWAPYVLAVLGCAAVAVAALKAGGGGRGRA